MEKTCGQKVVDRIKTKAGTVNTHGSLLLAQAKLRGLSWCVRGWKGSWTVTNNILDRDISTSKQAKVKTASFLVFNT